VTGNSGNSAKQHYDFQSLFKCPSRHGVRPSWVLGDNCSRYL